MKTRSSSSLILRNSKTQIWHLLMNSNTHAPLIHTLNILTVLVGNTRSNEQSIQPAIMLLGHDFSQNRTQLQKVTFCQEETPLNTLGKMGPPMFIFSPNRLKTYLLYPTLLNCGKRANKKKKEQLHSKSKVRCTLHFST